MKIAAALLVLVCSLAQAQIPQSSAMNIQIIIPSVLNISKDIHPIVVKPFEPVQQRITVFSNVKKYCVQFIARGFPIWDPKLLSHNAMVERRKICSTKTGTTEFVLEHQFGNVEEISWPVTIEVTAL